MDCSPPGSSVHGILQARILEWVALSFSSGIFLTGIKTMSLALAGGFFTAAPTWEAVAMGFASDKFIIISECTLMIFIEVSTNLG